MINKEEIVIIGWGMIGKALGHALDISTYIDRDIQLADYILKQKKYFILCLPTPTIDGKQDLTVIEEWLQKIKQLETNPIVVIRSTVLPGTTDRLAKKYQLRLAHVPEFLSEATALEDAHRPDLLVVGARDILVKNAVSLLFSPPYLEIKHKILTDPTTAELIKYSMNSFFALKVIYANQIWDVAKKVKGNYGQITEALESHKWGSKNGWDVWQGQFRGYAGHCLPKDTEAFAEKFKLPLLQKMIEINRKLLKETQ